MRIVSTHLSLRLRPGVSHPKLDATGYSKPVYGHPQKVLEELRHDREIVSCGSAKV